MSGRAVAIVQARMGSSRLPGKVLRPLAGRPVILRVVDRLRAVADLDEIVVAVPDTADDRPLVELLRAEGVAVHPWAGEAADLLGRYIGVGRAHDADEILMVDSDCPLLDPDTAGRMLAALRDAPDAEYVRIQPPSIEGGVACLRLATFERLDREGARGAEREHATLRILEHPEEFRIVEIDPDPMFADPADTHRFWLDTSADLRFLETLMARLERPGELVDLRDVVRLLREEPALREINGHVQQRDPRSESRWVALLPPEDGTGSDLFAAIAATLSERHRLGARMLRGPRAAAEAGGAACVVVTADDPRRRELFDASVPHAAIEWAERDACALAVAGRIHRRLDRPAAGASCAAEGVRP